MNVMKHTFELRMKDYMEESSLQLLTQLKQLGKEGLDFFQAF